MSEQPTIGERIREEREWLGLTRAQLARAADDFTEAGLADLENNARQPTESELARLTAVFGLDSVERLRGEPLRFDPRVMPSMSDRICAEDRYVVHRFAEFLRNAGPAPVIDREATTKTRGDQP